MNFLGAGPSEPEDDTCRGEHASVVVVSSGVDSLYVSARGEWKEGVREAFSALRDHGGDELIPVEMATGSYLLRPYGWRGYPVWLSSPRYEVMLGKPAPLPVAYVQVHSAFIHTVGVEEAAQDTERVLREFITAPQLAVSRIDVYADTQGWTPPADSDRYVCRARKRNSFHDVPSQEHSNGRRLEGLKFGKAEVSARIYDKTLELRNRGEDWPEVLWRDGDRDASVWRVELQFRSKALTRMRLRSVPDVLESRDALWEYGTRWLSLRTPTGSERRSNWPVAPEWEALRAIHIGTPRSPLVRERVRQAAELRLVQGFAGYLSSLGAAWEEDDLDRVLRRAGHTVRHYHVERGTSFSTVTQAKRRLRLGL